MHARCLAPGCLLKAAAANAGRSNGTGRGKTERTRRLREPPEPATITQLSREPELGVRKKNKRETTARPRAHPTPHQPDKAAPPSAPRVTRITPTEA